MITRVVHPMEVQARAASAIFDHLSQRELDPAATDCLARCKMRLGKGAYDFILPVVERRAMSTGDATAGGSWAGEGFVPSAFVSRENASPWRRPGAAEVYTIAADTIDRTGNPGTQAVAWPTIEDEGLEGSEYPENTTQTGTEPAFGAGSFVPRIFASGFVWASNKLVRDGGLTFQAGLGTALGKRVGRRENRAITTAALADVAVNKTASSAVAITIDEILDLVSSVSAEVREMPGVPKFMMHPNTLLALLKLKDGDVRAWRNAGLDRYPVIENSAMPSIATGNKAVLFGNLGAVKIVETQELTLVVATETRAEIYQTGFTMQVYSDAALLDRKGVELAALALG